MLSSGFISELSYVSLAYGLLHVSNEIENDKCEETGATRRGADYRTSKQLNRRIEALKMELWQFMAKYAHESKRIKSRNERLFKLALSKVHDTIQLDYLAITVLHLRFSPNERNKPLDEAFNWITNSESQLLAIMDLLDKTECRNKESEMFLLADKIVREL